MNKSRRWLLLALAPVVVLLILLFIAIGLIWQQIDNAPAIQLLPAKIRPTFRVIAERELPQKADGLRAILGGGREPAIFVRFETDSEGIAYIVETFGGPPVESWTLNPDLLRNLKASHMSVFHIPSLWEQKMGVHIFDPESIESARILEYPVGMVRELGYKILIRR